jgi:aminomethyltransferase
MTLSWRTSVLADRHRALGSGLEDWNGMGTAWTYAKDMAEEHVAIRTKAGLMDVSGLKKLHLVGPHAIAILQQVTTRDVTKLYPGKSVYACMLNDAGYFIEDCIIYRISPNAWMVVHGSGAGHEELTRSALGRNVAVLFDDDLHDLSLQ